VRSGTCPKCRGTKIILAHPPEYGQNSFEVPMAVTAEPRWILSGRNPRYGKGELVVYVCRSCGFVEWYALDPESIPIGNDYRTEVVERSKGSAEAAPQ